MAQVLSNLEVACPTCGETAEIPDPGAGVEVKLSPYVLAFGDHAKIECSDGHTFWAYFCSGDR